MKPLALKDVSPPLMDEESSMCPGLKQEADVVVIERMFQLQMVFVPGRLRIEV